MKPRKAPQDLKEQKVQSKIGFGGLPKRVIDSDETPTSPNSNRRMEKYSVKSKRSVQGRIATIGDYDTSLDTGVCISKKRLSSMNGLKEDNNQVSFVTGADSENVEKQGIPRAASSWVVKPVNSYQFEEKDINTIARELFEEQSKNKNKGARGIHKASTSDDKRLQHNERKQGSAQLLGFPFPQVSDDIWGSPKNTLCFSNYSATESTSIVISKR